MIDGLGRGQGGIDMESFTLGETDATSIEASVRELVGSEPKDFARATILIYDIFRLRDETGRASEIAGLFDVPATVLLQVASLVRSIRHTDPEPPDATVGAIVERINDLCRLVIMALDGNTDAAVVTHLVDLRDAVSTPHHTGRRETLDAAADRLTHLVNAFFFDRLTAIPTLRDYVIRLELGL